MTKLGRLVKEKKIKSLEHIYLHSIPIKEGEILDFFLGAPDRESTTGLKDEVVKIAPVQKQTKAGQRTRFRVSRHIWPQGASLAFPRPPPRPPTPPSDHTPRPPHVPPAAARFGVLPTQDDDTQTQLAEIQQLTPVCGLYCMLNIPSRQSTYWTPAYSLEAPHPPTLPTLDISRIRPLKAPLWTCCRR